MEIGKSEKLALILHEMVLAAEDVLLEDFKRTHTGTEPKKVISQHLKHMFPIDHHFLRSLKTLEKFSNAEYGPNLNFAIDKLQSAKMQNLLGQIEREIEILNEKISGLEVIRRTTLVEKETKIKEMNDELKEIQLSMSENVVKMEAKSKQRQNLIGSTHGESLGFIEADTGNIKKELELLQIQYQDEEMALRKKREKSDAELEGWKVKYETDVGEKQAEINAWKALYGADQSKFDELSEKYKELNRQWEKLQDDKAKEAQRQKEREEKSKKEFEASVKIQATWRGHKTRKDLKANSAKKEKGAGKAAASKKKKK